MKQPKKLTRAQKIHLSSYDMDANEWLYVDEDDICYTVYNKSTGEIKEVSKAKHKKKH